jgi:hypothetical protein
LAATAITQFMRILQLLFTLIVFDSAKGQTQNPFLSLKSDKVIVCDFESDGEHDYPIIDNKGQLTSIVKKYAQLDNQTINSLNSKLGDKSSYGQVEAECFEPHFGIIYFNGNKIVGQVEICLTCNKLVSTINIPAQKQGKQGQGKNAYYSLRGLSKSFRQFINGIIKKYNFSHEIQAGSNFDK